MLLVHGTPNNILASNNKGFMLFDHIYDRNAKTSNINFIKSGLDQYGPGIYAYSGEKSNYQENVKKAAVHVGSENGFVYLLNVDVSNKDLLNRRKATEIDESIWADVIDLFITKVRRDCNYDPDLFQRLASTVKSNYEDSVTLPLSAITTLFTENGFGEFQFDNMDMADHDNFEEWLEEAQCQFDLFDPCNTIFEEGGSLAVATYAIEASDDLWGVLMKVWERVAINNTGSGCTSRNKTFQDAVLETFSENGIDNFKAAKVNTAYESASFYVVFDTESITIEKTIQINKQFDTENSLSA